MRRLRWGQSIVATVRPRRMPRMFHVEHRRWRVASPRRRSWCSGRCAIEMGISRPWARDLRRSESHGFTWNIVGVSPAGGLNHLGLEDDAVDVAGVPSTPDVRGRRPGPLFHVERVVSASIGLSRWGRSSTAVASDSNAREGCARIVPSPVCTDRGRTDVQVKRGAVGRGVRLQASGHPAWGTRGRGPSFRPSSEPRGAGEASV